MSDFIEKTERNLSALGCLIGEDNTEDIKKRIADLIIDKILRKSDHLGNALIWHYVICEQKPKESE